MTATNQTTALRSKTVNGNPLMTGTEMVNWIKNNDKALGRALVVLRDLQTSDEKAVKLSLHVNFRGFKKGDAKRGTADANFFAHYGYLTDDMISYWRTQTKQGQRLTVYWRQLLAAAHRKQAAQAQIDAMKTVTTAQDYSAAKGKRSIAA